MNIADPHERQGGQHQDPDSGTEIAAVDSDAELK